jgi:HJR/Mrr/RecB family endonuclease
MARHPDYGDHSFDDRLDDLLTRKREVNRTVLAPAAPAAGDLENLYATTFEAAEEHTDSRAVPLDLDQIDLLEPLAFEDWVLRQLADGGYGVRRTPHQDVGADGLAFWRSDEQPHTLLIQCKHTQRGEPCDIGAVQEVLNALPAYVSSIEGLPVLLVVTNAAAFTRRAGKLAQERKVTLLSRTDLPSLRGFRPPSRAL